MLRCECGGDWKHVTPWLDSYGKLRGCHWLWGMLVQVLGLEGALKWTSEKRKEETVPPF